MSKSLALCSTKMDKLTIEQMVFIQQKEIWLRAVRSGWINLILATRHNINLNYQNKMIMRTCNLMTIMKRVGMNHFLKIKAILPWMNKLLPTKIMMNRWTCQKTIARFKLIQTHLLGVIKVGGLMIEVLELGWNLANMMNKVATN